MTNPTRQTENVQMFTGATVNGIQTQAEVIMERRTPKDWPLAAQALNKWEALTQSLGAQDVSLPIKALSMNPKTGGIYNAQKNPQGQTSGITPTRTALQHFMGFIPAAPGQAVDNLEWYAPATRAVMFADIINRVPERSIALRTAIKGMVGKNESRVIRAVVSDIHSKEHGDDLALITQLRRLPNEVLETARMRIVKEWDYTHVEMLIPNKVVEVRPGVVVEARINLKNSETKGGSFEAMVGTMNFVCSNGMVGGGSNSTVSVKHVGDIRTKMKAGVVTVIDLAEIYLEEYLTAYKTALPMPRSEAIAKTVKRFKLPETTGAALATLWDIDGERGGGDTVAGLANAMTRYAQQLPVEKALTLEEQAGKLVSMGLDALV